jgi:hypothetical protein
LLTNLKTQKTERRNILQGSTNSARSNPINTMMNMKVTALLFVSIQAMCLATTHAFVPASVPQTKARLGSLNAYVPDGLTPEQYQKIKAADKKKIGKDLGRLGPRGFKSRSMKAWQEAFERGETGHTFAPLGYKEKLNKRQIKKEEVPVGTTTCHI